MSRVAYWCPVARPEVSPTATASIQRLPVWPHDGRFPDAIHIVDQGAAWLIGNNGAAGPWQGETIKINATAIDWHRSTTNLITCVWLSDAAV